MRKLLEVPPFRGRYKIPVPVMESRPTADGHGTLNVEVGDREEWVIVEIDMKAIVNFMGRNAVESKGGKCSDGHVVVRHSRPRGRRGVVRG